MFPLLSRHFYLGRLASRTEDEFINAYSEDYQVRPDALRWFGGMHDLKETFICQLL